MQHEKKGFGYVYQKFMRNTNLTLEAKAIFNYLASFAGDKYECYPNKILMLNDLNISEQRFDKHMKILTDRGYVIKNRIRKKGKLSNNLYTINPFPITSLDNENPRIENPRIENLGVEIQGIEIQGMENKGHNNNSINNNRLNSNSSNNIIVDTADALPTTSKFPEGSFEMLCVETIINNCLELYPKSKVPSTYKEKEKWAIEIDRMKRIDNRTEEEIKQTLQFALKDSFWATNIRSTKKFREKFETLHIQSVQKRNGNKTINKGKVLQDEFVNSAKEWLKNESTGIS